jgi:hypothetical protein
MSNLSFWWSLIGCLARTIARRSESKKFQYLAKAIKRPAKKVQLSRSWTDGYQLKRDLNYAAALTSSSGWLYRWRQRTRPILSISHVQIIFVATDLSNFYTLCRNTFCREVLSPFMPAMGRVDVNSTAFCLSRYLFTAATKRAIETKVAILRDTRRNMYSKHYLKCVSSTIARNYSCNGCETSLTEL